MAAQRKLSGKLTLEEEILPRLIMTRGNLNPGLDDPNKPPSISIDPVDTASVGSPVTLTALVTDDGLPKPRVPKARPVTEPGKAQTNAAVTRPRAGLSVSWYRIPRASERAAFDSEDPIRVGTPGEPIIDGKAVTTVRFSQPGTYVLRATANDGELSISTDTTITVK